jgi:hypothetical protein
LVSSASLASALAPERGLPASFNPGPLAICFAPRFPRSGPPAGGQNGQRPHSSPTTSNCPASSRAMAGTDSNKEAAPGSIGEPQVGFTTNLLRKRGWLERIAGSNVASPAKGSRHGKLSSFHPVEQRLHAGGERHAAAAAIGGPALMFRGNPVRPRTDSSPRIRFVTTRATPIARPVL